MLFNNQIINDTNINYLNKVGMEAILNYDQHKRHILNPVYITSTWEGLTII